jgi:hypothetical protein
MREAFCAQLLLCEEGGVDVGFDLGVIAADCDMGRRQQEDLAGDPLDLAVEAE